MILKAIEALPLVVSIGIPFLYQVKLVGGEYLVLAAILNTFEYVADQGSRCKLFTFG